jgi:periplasmic protein TonB
MFESILKRGTRGRRRLGAGSLVSIGLHAAAVGAVTWLSFEPKADVAQEREIKFVAAPAPRVAAEPKPAAGAERRVEKVSRSRAQNEPRQTVDQRTVPLDANLSPATSGDEFEGGLSERSGSGESSGDSGSTGSSNDNPGAGGTDVVPFGEGMTMPRCGWHIDYTREALEARSTGTVILKCNVMADGSVQGCRALKSVAHMTEAVLAGAAKTRCTPATFQGKPVSVSITQTITLALPD